MADIRREFIERCVANLDLLDEFVGGPDDAQNLEPFPLAVVNSASVNDAARRIAEFIGLGRYRFLVAFGSEEEAVAGRIELRNDVRITVGGIQMRANFGESCSIMLAETLRSHSGAIVAALAHEITHKYLLVNAVPSLSGAKDGFEDEVLTDIASVWLGLGKLVLNGCESRFVTTNWSGTKTMTSCHTVGYLNRTQFAFAYLTVAARRGVHEGEYEGGLSADALTDVRDVRKQKALFDNAV